VTEIEARARIIVEARAWIGTPYRARGRIKGHGADCLQFVWSVFFACGLTPDMPLQNYSEDWHLHQDQSIALDIVAGRLRALDPGEMPLPGDVALYHVGRAYAHGAVIVDPGWPSVIHAWKNAGKVVLEPHGNSLAFALRDRHAPKTGGRSIRFFSRFPM
jgi:cell wall-associated NlpC family hydrolase